MKTELKLNISPRIIFEEDYRVYMHELDTKVNENIAGIHSSPKRVLLDIALKGLGDELVLLCYLPETNRYATWVCLNDGNLITLSGNCFFSRSSAEKDFIKRQNRR